ncbi:MAG: sialate O-acetylesterase [Alteromonas macleodii]|uniref:sialate O-acetylesterase n=1 Tax=Alteromonas TaxID=226 RepID=UPI00127BD637|nr:sialate O-acetylesterase [Alteromonas macleodii]MCG8495235.1 sialate O-acetylesterase [Enterobacterales bacterium]MDM7961556.1 sialate O-acetylesterase [Alteromonas macleodii]MDM8169106.1 sialate O-acetylesterase [Alteromonas macleodii]CAI3969836.1 sialate O-acetylesterase [Alteromonas macleodii]VTP57927.1 sialate O-acetylesterase [Alteromonas macleodii]
MKQVVFRCTIILLIFSSRSAFAEVKLPSVLSDHAVLQRDIPVSLWGWSSPEEKVTIFLNGETLAVTKADKEDGIWRTSLPKQPAGGPHTLTFVGNNTVEVKDVYFGDLWLASGQSNMVLPLARIKEKFPDIVANESRPLIREFSVPMQYNFKQPNIDVKDAQWKSADKLRERESFSAVSFFFARAIQDDVNVPVGIVLSAVGGTPIQSWMSEDALASFPEDLKEAKHFQSDNVINSIISQDAERQRQWEDYISTHDKGNVSPYWWSNNIDESDWTLFSVPGFLTDAEQKPINGVHWFRKRFQWPRHLVGEQATLVLGALVDADTTYVNGTKVGQTTYKYPPRRYTVPADVLKPGSNTITIRLESHRDHSGFVSDKEYWIGAGETRVDLNGEWHYKLGVVHEHLQQTTFIQYKPMGLYNAMINPLTSLPIKGVIWYQGESNTANPDKYGDMFKTMIEDWRNKWNNPTLPFLFVQLANFNPRLSTPAQSGWAELREQQASALSLPNTGMAVAIDVGEWNDIHPLDKESVGERLAKNALHKVYGKDIVYSGPMATKVTLKGSHVWINFKYQGGGLSTSGTNLTGFEIADESEVFHWAKAEIKGERVQVWHPDVKHPSAVRYAWADNPAANLYNKDGLPAAPFRFNLD